MSGRRAREVRSENAQLAAWARSQFEDADYSLKALRFARAFRKARRTIGVQHRVKCAGVIRVTRLPPTPEAS